MDKVLSEMNCDTTTLAISNVNVGCAAHADDIRSCTIGATNVSKHADKLHSLMKSNFLSLNMNKTEIIDLSRHPTTVESISALDATLETKKEAKYLGVWWCQDLSSTRSIEENILKARRAFFALGAIDIFQGSCNPLTARSIFNIYVLPILLYGCEAWFLTDPLLHKLESFQGEVGRRILRLPRCYNNLSVRIGLRWPSFKVLILLRKLTFLANLLSKDTQCVSSRLFWSLVAEDPLCISLVQQCKEMELSYGTNFWDQCLKTPEIATRTVGKAKTVLLDADWQSTLSIAGSHPSLTYISDESVVNEWCNVWNEALEYGTKGTKTGQNIFRILCRPVFGDRMCPHCSSPITEQMFADHMVTSHNLPLNSIMSNICSRKSSLLFSPPICDSVNIM